MKFVNRIFLVLGAMSMFSLVQFDAMGAEGCNSVDAGRYCLKKNDKYACPAGCWCEKKTKVSAVADISGLPSDKAVKYACATKDPSTQTALAARGVHYCPNGKTSTTGAKKDTDCKDGETAYDGSNNCISETSGRYCSSKGTQHDCPKGCYCTGSKNAVGEQWWNGDSGAWETIPVTSWCNNNSRWLSDYLVKRGIHYCPEDFPNSDKKESSEKKCYFETNNNKKVYADEVVTARPGYFLPQSSVTESQCRAGSYCPGGELRPSAKKDVGIYQCPTGYRDGDAGAQSLNDCENSNGERYYIDASVVRDLVRCEPGEYLDTTASSSRFTGARCVLCEPGYFCPDGIKHERCTGTRKYSTAGASVCSTCPMAQRANSENTGCEPMTIGGTETAAERVDVGSLIAPEALCVDSQSHKVYFLRGAGNAAGTMNPVNKCTDDTVTLPSSGFTRADYQFDEWNCDNNIGPKVAGATFTMPNANVTCTAQWTYSGSTGGDNGGGTGGSTGGDNTGDGDDNTPVSCTTPGKYWNGDYCENCESGYFCPGDGDEYRCPLSGTTTTNRASCKLNVSKTQMYGNNGNKCWKYTGVSRASDYRDCVYGDHLESYPH